MNCIVWRAMILLALGCGSLAGCGRTNPAEEHDAEHEEHANGEEHHDDGERTIRLDDSTRREFEIETATAGPGSIRVVLDLPGEVRPNGDRLAHIVPRYSGIVTEVRKRVGDSVSEGDILAVLESDESLSPYEIRSLIAGTVIHKHITRGEAVDRESDTFVIADLSTVWVDLSVYPKDMLRVRVGQRARISAGHDLPEVEGSISYVTPVAEEATRTSTARVELPNPTGLWRPGMFVTGRVMLERISVPVAVPATALQLVGEDPAVFVETAEGFAPRAVTLGRSDGELLEITGGLAAGERYVARGAFTLKAEWSKASFGDGHAH